MNYLLIGGSSHLMDRMIIKLKKEGHRVYLLTGEQFHKSKYEKTFERYDFSYDSDELGDIFESVRPDVTVYFGAYDSVFNWKDEERTAVKYISSLMNIMMSYSMVKKGRFIYLSSEEVYGHGSREAITEDIMTSADSFKGMTLAQAENICTNYRENWELDIFVLRLDHLYNIPSKLSDLTHICGQMCLSALSNKYILSDRNSEFSMIYEADAVEFIYKVASAGDVKHHIYNITSGKGLTEYELGEFIKEQCPDEVRLTAIDKTGKKCVLSGERFFSEFGMTARNNWTEDVGKMCSQMIKRKKYFTSGIEEKVPFYKRVFDANMWVVRALIPFLENVVCFIPFFMLNNRAVGSEYFGKIDFFLFYVLIFAIVYGQQQAIFSAILAVLGYIFRQMYTRTGFDVMLDYSTYIWIAQLFIVGLVVGYMRDQIKTLRQESKETNEHLNRQIGEIKDINNSNIRVKDVLENQVINQQDSIGKIYSITSMLDKYTPEEVGFYAVEMISKLFKSGDVALYNVHGDYARMFSATSEKARELGNSVKYKEMKDMYDDLKEHRVFINRSLDARYPLMANAIYEQDDMKMIVMVWGITWERMTLGQANILTVICYLIQNATLRATRYMAALEEERYTEDTQVLKPQAFSSLVYAFYDAGRKNLTNCVILRTDVVADNMKDYYEKLKSNLRQSDYMGFMNDGYLYILLVNTKKEEVAIVTDRLKKAGISGCHVENLKV